jgi:hypothetical protein
MPRTSMPSFAGSRPAFGKVLVDWRRYSVPKTPKVLRAVGERYARTDFNAGRTSLP